MHLPLSWEFAFFLLSQIELQLGAHALAAPVCHEIYPILPSLFKF